MKALQAYIDEKNKFAALFKGTPYEIETPEGRKRLAEHIDSALSPENLSCDGELPRSEIVWRLRQLTLAGRELLKLDPTLKFYELD